MIVIIIQDYISTEQTLVRDSKSHGRNNVARRARHSLPSFPAFDDAMFLLQPILFIGGSPSPMTKK